MFHTQALRNVMTTETAWNIHCNIKWFYLCSLANCYTECPTRYRIRHFFNNSNTNEDIATEQTHTTDTFLFISHTTNVLLFKCRCNILISVRITKEMPGSVASGTPCIITVFLYSTLMMVAKATETRR